MISKKFISGARVPAWKKKKFGFPGIEIPNHFLPNIEQALKQKQIF